MRIISRIWSLVCAFAWFLLSEARPRLSCVVWERKTTSVCRGQANRKLSLGERAEPSYPPKMHAPDAAKISLEGRFLLRRKIIDCCATPADCMFPRQFAGVQRNRMRKKSPIVAARNVHRTTGFVARRAATSSKNTMRRGFLCKVIFT